MFARELAGETPALPGFSRMTAIRGTERFNLGNQFTAG